MGLYDEILSELKKTEVTEVTEATAAKSLRKNCHFWRRLKVTEEVTGTQDVISASFREGPTYPDGLGRVKCDYCQHLDLKQTSCGTVAHCRKTLGELDGISLLRECEKFEMNSVH